MANARKYIVGLIGAVFAMGTLAGCGTASASGGHHRTIIVGEDDSLTGPLALYGVPQHQATALAIEQVNKAGGLLVHGHRYHVVLDYLNDNGDPTTAASNVRKLIFQDHVQFLVGFTDGTLIIPSMSVIAQNQIPTIVGVAAARRVTSIPNHFVFHTRPPGDYTGASAGAFIAKTLGIKQVAVVGQLSIGFYKEYADGLQLSLQADGGHVTTMQSFSPTTQDMYPQLTAAIATHPQAIFVPAYVGEAAFVYKQARQLGFKGTLMGFTGGSTQQFEKVDSPQVLSGIYDLMPGELTGSDYQVVGTDARTFLKQFQSKYGTVAAPSTGYAYDAVRILFRAIQNAGTTNSKAVVNALKKMPVPTNSTLKFIPVHGRLFDPNHQAYIANVAFKWYGGHWHFYRQMQSPVTRYSHFLSTLRAHGGK